MGRTDDLCLECKGCGLEGCTECVDCYADACPADHPGCSACNGRGRVGAIRLRRFEEADDVTMWGWPSTEEKHDG